MDVAVDARPPPPQQRGVPDRGRLPARTADLRDLRGIYCPTVRDESDQIARALNTLPKYVASRTLANPEWAGTTALRDLPREVAQLKGRPAKPIFVLGSANLAQTLIEQDLVDEYQLWLHSVVIGAGKTLFRHGNPFTELAVVDSHTSGNGLVILT
jgi:dihydrofolate reductase